MLSRHTVAIGRSPSTVTIRSLTVKEKILLHLFDYNRFAEGYEAPPEVTQEAIAQAVGIRVHHVSQYMKPLISESFVEERTSHVRGRPRRRKVYFLTPGGRGHVAALRGVLLEESVPLRRAVGEGVLTPLARIYQEERRGSSLLELLQELAASGAIAETSEVRAPGTIEFTQEAVRPERFYGRRAEIDGVLRAVAETPMVVVTGMAGIGKTALGAMVCEELRGHRSLFWREVRPWDTATDLALRLAAFLKSHGRLATSSILIAGAARELGRLEECLQADLEGLPALLVYDDVHQADNDAPSFLILLLKILKRRTGTSALVLSRTVPEFYSRRDVAVEGSVRELALQGLDPTSSAALLGDMGIRDPLAGSLVKTCGGIPLFLKLVAHSRLEGTPESGWQTLEAYISEQIEPALDDAERACMEAASFYYVPVPSEGLLVEGKAGRRTLLSLERKGLLSPFSVDRYTAHDAIQTYFQKALSSERRAALAPLVSAWLSVQGGNAETKGRLQEAIMYLGNAVAIERGRVRPAATLHRLGDLRRHVGDHLGAKEAYQEALGGMQDPGTKARLLQKIGLCLEKLGRLDDADREIEQGLKLMPGHPSPEAAWLFYQSASVAYERQDYGKALAEVERVTSWLAGLPRDPELWGWLANLRGLVHLYDPSRFDPTLAQEDFREAIDAWKTIDNKRGLCMTYNNYFLAAVELGQGDAALSYLDECIAIAERLGDVPARETAMFTKAWFLSEYRGDYEAADALYKQTYRLAKETHERFKVVYHYEHFAGLYRRQGRNEEAKESLEYFLDESGPMLNPANRIEVLTLMVRICVRCAHTDQADGYLEEALRLAAAHPTDFAEAVIGWARALLLAQRGNRQGAAASFQRASEATWPASQLEDRIEFLIDYGRFLASLGETARARDVLLHAQQELPPGREPLAKALTDAFAVLLRPEYDRAGRPAGSGRTS